MVSSLIDCRRASPCQGMLSPCRLASPCQGMLLVFREAGWAGLPRLGRNPRLTFEGHLPVLSTGIIQME